MSGPTPTIFVLLIIVLFDFAQLHQHHSNEVVFYVRPDAQLSVRQLVKDHGLEYVSEVFPGSNYHHALIKEMQVIDKLSADPRVITFLNFTYFLKLIGCCGHRSRGSKGRPINRENCDLFHLITED